MKLSLRTATALLSLLYFQQQKLVGAFSSFVPSRPSPSLLKRIQFISAPGSNSQQQSATRRCKCGQIDLNLRFAASEGNIDVGGNMLLQRRARIFSIFGSMQNHDSDPITENNRTNENTKASSDGSSEKNINVKSSMSMSDRIIQAAADLTTSTSSLLGTKSIGVDYGLVRTGIAVSNGYNPQPLSIVSNLNNTELSTRIIKLVETEAANQIVVGLPFHKNGTEADQTVITRNFASQLNCAVCAHFGFGAVPIYLWDERYTSKEAESRIRAFNPRAGKLYKELDAEAASIILEYYYGDNGLGAELVEMPDNDEINSAIERAWLIRKEEKRIEMQALKDQRMNAGNVKQQLMEKGRLLDEKLAKSVSVNKKKGKKKKKKKKRTWINLTSNMTSSVQDKASD